jgi:hypothetical protein
LGFLVFSLLFGLLDMGHHAAAALNLALGQLVPAPRIGVITGSQLNAYGCPG